MDAGQNQKWAEAMNVAGSKISEVNGLLDSAKSSYNAGGSWTGHNLVEEAQRGLTKAGLALQAIEDIRLSMQGKPQPKGATGTVGDVGGNTPAPSSDKLAPLTGRALFLVYFIMTSQGATNNAAAETELRTLLGGQAQLSAAITAYSDGGQYYKPALNAVAEMAASNPAALAKLQSTVTVQQWLDNNLDKSVLPATWSEVLALIGR